MSRVLRYIASQPWAITQDALELILEVAARENRSVEAIERELGRPLQNTRNVRIRDGVAVIPVAGPLFRYANLFTHVSGATSYEELAADTGQALANPEVTGLVFDVDSPGGLVNGALETAELISRARQEKPTATVFSGAGASAAYLLGIASARVVVTPMAMVGSVGTVLSITDTSEDTKAKGVKSIEFVSSQSPKKRLDPFSSDPREALEARTDIHAMVDTLAQVFIEAVAKYRGVDAETVLSDFGQGGILIGQQAVDAGMADSVGTLEDVIKEMQGRRRGGGVLLRPGAAGKHRSPTSTLEAAMPNVQDDGRAEMPVIDRAYLEANHGDLVAAIMAEERERIHAIQQLHGPAEVKAACVADPAVTAGDAAIRLNAAQRAADEARGRAHLEGRAGAEAELNAPKPSAAIDPGVSDERAEAKRLVALHHQLTGRGSSATLSA